MANLGTMSLLLALALGVYAMAGSVAGHRLGVAELVASSRRSVHVATLAVGVAVATLVYSFLTHDFSIAYVHENSNLAMDPAFTWVAFYAGNEGSLLYISFVLAAVSSLSLLLAPARMRAALPYFTAIMMGILVFFVGVMVSLANPFEQLSEVPADGQGINPLLTHPGMFIHPPLQMAGLASVAVPFAFVAGSLIAGRARDEWLDAARVSGILVWAVLSAGLLIGAWWAYTILGWGGYWGWDPIENVALMPWLVLTAFIHSVMVQKRRGMFRMWNVVLLSLAFVLAQFGMFINRGGPVVSVHSFGQSTIGFVFLGFMIVSLAFAFGVFFWRYSILKSDRPLESFLSREASFLANNFLLLGITFVTLWGVIFPLFSELVRNTTVTVSAPWYNQINGPMMLALVILMGIGPLLPWRRSNRAAVQRWLLFPAIVGAATFAGLWAFGIRELWAAIAFASLAFVITGILEEWGRGTRAQRRAGTSAPVAFWRMIINNRPRHGGYIVHIAILTLGIGVIGTSFFQQRADVALSPGESYTIDEYRVEFVDVESAERSDRIAQWANVNVYRDGELLERLEPWRAFYPAFNMASVRASIRSTPVEDLYIVPSDFLEDGRALFRISINPMAWWLWVSGPILLLGTVIALWPAPALESRSAVAARGRQTSEAASSASSGAAPASA